MTSSTLLHIHYDCHRAGASSAIRQLPKPSGEQLCQGGGHVRRVRAMSGIQICHNSNRAISSRKDSRVRGAFGPDPHEKEHAVMGIVCCYEIEVYKETQLGGI